jgi:uncharacterized protein YjbJ (UPF0337 family)
MKRKDEFILEQLYQENIWDRLKGQTSGLKQGAGTFVKNVGGKLSGDTGPRKSARAEYAKAQQTSLLNSFKKKVDNEINDFNNDLKSFKVDPNPNNLEKDFPIIAQRLKEIEKLQTFLKNPSSAPAPSSTSPETDDDIETPEFEVLPPEEAPTLPSSQERKALPYTQTKETYSVDEVANLLKISTTELQNKVATNQIKASRDDSGNIVFNKNDIEDYRAGERSKPLMVDDEGMYDTAEKAYGEDEPELQSDVFSNVTKKPSSEEPPKDWLSSGEEETSTPRTTPKKVETKPPFTNQTPQEAPVGATSTYTNSKYKKTESGWINLKGQKVISPNIIKKLEDEYFNSRNKPKGSQKPIRGDQTLTAREKSFKTAAQRKAEQTTSESFNVFGEFLKENNLL